MSEGRRGGREARRAVRTSMAVRALPALQRTMPLYEVLSPERLDRIHDTAMRVLGDGRHRLPRGRGAGQVGQGRGQRRRRPRPDPARAADGSGRARHPSASRCTPATRPSRPRSAATRMVFGPTYGSPFVRGFDGERRYGTIEDLNNFHKLAYMAPALQNTGAVDLRAGRRRHPQAAPAHHRLGDPPQRQELHGPGHPPDRAAGRGAHVRDRLRQGVRPRQRGHGGPGQRQLAAGLGRHHDRRACASTPAPARPLVVAPFTLAGANTPASATATVAELMAEALSAIAYAQLERPGAQDDPGQLPRRRVDEVRRADGRHRRARPDEPDDRPARPALQAALALVRHAHRLQGHRRPGRLRERLQHVPDHAGRRQLRHALRRLDRGRA